MSRASDCWKPSGNMTWNDLYRAVKCRPYSRDTLINIGKDREAHTLLKEAQALFKESGASYFYAITLVHLGNVALGLGNPAEARDWLEKAHPLFREIGEQWGLSFVLNNLGEVARVQGSYQEAQGYYKESAALLRATGDKGDL